MNLYGLIGYPLAQSFSKKFFTEKFEKEGIGDCRYELFELSSIDLLPALLKEQKDLKGFNVTIPYKQQVIPFLDEIHGEAEFIGACNCIKIYDNKIVGHNTDAAAFEFTLLENLQPHHTHALILGTGGAAQAVEYTLRKLGIVYKFVSRTPHENQLGYDAVTQEVLAQYNLLINTTPLGSYPNVEGRPPIPYQWITSRHYFYDLVYNPSVTAFLKEAGIRGAITKNGYDMLVGQAELSWNIWNQN